MNRADRLYGVIADGRRHSRHEIFRACGEFFLTNNAASELRAKRGLAVEHTVEDGEHFYQIVTLEPPAEMGLGPHPVPPLAGGSSVDDQAPSYGRSVGGEPTETSALPIQPSLFSVPRGAYEDAA